MPHATGRQAHTLHTQIPHSLHHFIRSFFSCWCCQRDIVYASDERANGILPIEKLQGEKFGFCGYGTVYVTAGIPGSPPQI